MQSLLSGLNEGSALFARPAGARLSGLPRYAVLVLAAALLAAVVGLLAVAATRRSTPALVVPPSVTLWPPPAPVTDMVPPAGSVALTSAAFASSAPVSALVDVLWADARPAPRRRAAAGSVKAPFRHLLHRGSADFDAAGLPLRMSPGVIAAPDTNDLLLFVDTTDATGAPARDSVRLRDVPLTTPFRLGIVVTAGRLEAYVNGRLTKTLILSGAPTPLPPGDSWHGLAGSQPLANAALQNLVLWAGEVPLPTMRAAGAGAPVFPAGAAGFGSGTCGSGSGSSSSSGFDAFAARVDAAVDAVLAPLEGAVAS
jgi:hypothetical protein